MALSNGSLVQSLSSEELLDAQAHIWNHTFSFINSMCLKCAVKLGIPDTIYSHGKPMILSELTNALPINKARSDCVSRLMRVLIHSNFFCKIKISDQELEDQEGYWLTPASRLLLKNDTKSEPLSTGPFVLAMLDPVLADPWHQVAEWFQNDVPTTFMTTHGRPRWEYASQEPKMNQFFNEAMSSDARLLATLLVNDCRQVFEGLNSIIDVGGGTGMVAKAIAEAFPSCKCSVLDLPHVVDQGINQSIDNVTFIGGNMFESIPPADAVFLKWIFPCWSDDDCVKILERCKEAISSAGNGGKVIIVEMVVDDRKEVETQLMFDMLMMINHAGKERTQEEWAKLFSDAGFTTYKITHKLGLRSLIEVFP